MTLDDVCPADMRFSVGQKDQCENKCDWGCSMVTYNDENYYCCNEVLLTWAQHYWWVLLIIGIVIFGSIIGCIICCCCGCCACCSCCANKRRKGKQAYTAQATYV